MTSGRSRAVAGIGDEISGAVTGTILRYVRDRVGLSGVRKLLARADDKRRPTTLEDPSTWSSCDQVVELIDAAAGVLGDPDAAFHIGAEMLRQFRGTEIGSLVETTGSADGALRAAVAALRRAMPAVDLRIVEHGADSTTISARAPRHTGRPLYLCDLTKGFLSQVPTFFGKASSPIREPECQARGGRHCLYELSSSGHEERAAPPGTEPESLETKDPDPEQRLGTMSRRLEELYASAADLAATDDRRGALQRITERAARTLGADRYVLVVTHPGAQEPEAYAGGLTAGETETLVRGLLGGAGVATEDGIVADVESPAGRHGHLAMIRAGGGFDESDRQILAAYTSYVAAALDIGTLIERARRSDESASALLEFSRALAGTSTADEVSWKLAETVPIVARCDRSTVMLWDPVAQELRVHAATGPGAEALSGNPEERAGYRLSVHETPLLDLARDMREIVVLDRETDDDAIRTILEQTGTACAVVAPLASDEFFGIVTANYDTEPLTDVHSDADLHARMLGLADHAVTALQNARLLEQVTHLAWHDALTGLPNRRLLEDRVSQELARAMRSGESTCMFFVDLDRLKQVNDSFGHPAGDDLIKRAAERLVDTVRRQDTVARLGGDEFAVLLPGLADLGDIDTLARRTLGALRMRYAVDGDEIHVSGSIGVAVAPGHGETYDELISNADAAMYRAKSLGRDTYQLYSIPEGGARPDVQLEVDLRHAIERAEMTVLYQPVFEMTTSEVVSVEALARWLHPVRGVLDPGSFIGIARDPEVIAGIDSWVVTEACRQIAVWASNGLAPLGISVNVAASSLTSDGFSASLEAALSTYGVEPSLIELEVADMGALESEGPARTYVDRLLSMGVHFAVDDVGAASLAFSRIGSVPIASLKLDGSFVHLLDDDEDAANLVGAVVALTSRHGIRCVAEGVETEREARSLLEKGCHIGQGFLFSPPLLPSDVEQMLASGSEPPARETGQAPT
jgi:diguanylate cyclase (GGDEF)-like protein